MEKNRTCYSSKLTVDPFSSKMLMLNVGQGSFPLHDCREIIGIVCYTTINEVILSVTSSSSVGPRFRKTSWFGRVE